MSDEILSYAPSAIDEEKTILQQLNGVKKLLEKYPSQQYFSTSVPLTKQITNTLAKDNVELDGRQINVGDFVVGVIENATVVGLGQITAVDDDYVYYRYLGSLTGVGIENITISEV